MGWASPRQLIPSNMAPDLDAPKSWDFEEFISAPAKVNLFFQTFPKEPGSLGLHQVRSLIAPCSLTDTIQVKVSWHQGTPFSVRIRLADQNADHLLDSGHCVNSDHSRASEPPQGPDLPLGPDNLLWQAAAAWWEAWQGERDTFAPHIDLTLAKNIPWAAGLGGGSSDAAALLRILQTQLPYPVSEEKMARNICPDLGSDVYPAYLRQMLAVDDTGHRIASLYAFSPPILSPSCLLLTFPDIHFSTPLFYKDFDALAKQEGTDSLLSNSFAPLSLVAFPPQTKLLQELATFTKEESLTCRSGRDLWQYLQTQANHLPVREKILDRSWSLPEISLSQDFWPRLWDQGDLYVDLSGTGPTIFLLYPPWHAEPIARLAAHLQEVAARLQVKMKIHWTQLLL